MKDLPKQFAAGLFFIASVAIIVGVIFLLGMDKGLTEPKFEMRAVFRNVGGLSNGAPVRLSGVTVGTVKDIDFLEKDIQGRSVDVRLSLLRKYRDQVLKGTRVAIITEGVLGEKVVEISTDPDFRRMDLDDPVIGEDPLDVQNLAETFGEAAVSLLETSKTLDTITREMQKISGTSRRVLNRIEQRVIDGNLFRVF